MKTNYQVCKNCVMDTSDPEITFDENGICDFCDNFNNVILASWSSEGDKYDELMKIAEKIKREGKGKEYDCIIGISGGVDSSYLAYVAKEVMGLRPLMLTVDTGWNLNVANENVHKLLKKLELDLETIVVNWEEMKDLQLAFLKSQVPYQDTPQDHAIFAGLYNYAAKHGIKYVFTGANYSTEGVKPPQEWTYLNDIKMIKDIHNKFGNLELKTFPLCGMFKYKLYYRYVKGLRVVHPLNYIKYEKDEVVSLLKEKFGWEEYENKHYENIFTRFYEGYYLPRKFGYDKRKIYFSNLILTNQMSRDEALEMLKKNPYSEDQAMLDLEYICDKLDIKKDYFIDLMNSENKTFRDYKNSAKIIKLAIKLAKTVGMEKRNFRV